jgi:hypothetical protein
VLHFSQTLNDVRLCGRVSWRRGLAFLKQQVPLFQRTFSEHTHHQIVSAMKHSLLLNLNVRPLQHVTKVFGLSKETLLFLVEGKLYRVNKELQANLSKYCLGQTVQLMFIDVRDEE